MCVHAVYNTIAAFRTNLNFETKVRRLTREREKMKRKTVAMQGADWGLALPIGPVCLGRRLTLARAKKEPYKIQKPTEKGTGKRKGGYASQKGLDSPFYSIPDSRLKES